MEEEPHKYLCKFTLGTNSPFELLGCWPLGFPFHETVVRNKCVYSCKVMKTVPDLK